MRRLADFLAEHGDDEETIGRKLAMPKNGLMNAVGGQTEDAESVMQERLEKMGGGPLPDYEQKADRKMAKDRRRRLALDQRRFDEWYPDAARWQVRPLI